VLAYFNSGKSVCPKTISSNYLVIFSKISYSYDFKSPKKTTATSLSPIKFLNSASDANKTDDGPDFLAIQLTISSAVLPPV